MKLRKTTLSFPQQGDFIELVKCQRLATLLEQWLFRRRSQQTEEIFRAEEVVDYRRYDDALTLCDSTCVVYSTKHYDWVLKPQWQIHLAYQHC
jgi:hypothetical protein